MKTQVLLRSTALTAYRRSYEKKGQPDSHIAVFGSLQSRLPAAVRRVLYPGCHRHITASLCFPHVEYVDCDIKVADVYQDDVVREWIIMTMRRRKHKEKLSLLLTNYQDDDDDDDNNDDIIHDDSFPQSTWNFTCASFHDKLDFARASFDLLISLSAGIVSTPCLDYMKQGGYLLVNDSHGDASTAYVHPQWTLRAVYQNSNKDDDNNHINEWVTDAHVLQEYFVTTNRGTTTTLTPEQAKEAATIGTKSKRSYKLVKEAPFYLFQKTAQKRRHDQHQHKESLKAEQGEVTCGNKRRKRGH